MSLQYILDGYNIVKQIPAFSHKELQTARQGLYSLLELRQPQGSPRNKITIVFDSKSTGSTGTEHTSAEVIFSKGRSADEKIKEIILHSKNPSCQVVVTDDRLLRLEARSLGARIMGVKEFLNKPARRHKGPQETKEVSFTVQHKITSEMRKIWLKETDRKEE